MASKDHDGRRCNDLFGELLGVNLAG